MQRLSTLLGTCALALLSTTVQAQLIPQFSIEGDTILRLTHRYSVMADNDGTFDQPSQNVSVENAQFDGTETLIATVAKGDNSVRLFDATDGRQIWQSDGGQETETLAFTEDNAYLVTGGENRPEMTVWDVTDGSIVRTYSVGTSVEGMRFNADFSLLATGSEAGQIRIYATPGNDPLQWPDTPIAILDQGPDRDRSGRAADGHSDVNQIEWSQDGRFFFSAGRDGNVVQWEAADTGDGWQFDSITTFSAGLRGSLKSVDLSVDGTLLASTSNFLSGTGIPTPCRVVVHEVATGEVVLDYTIPNSRVPENVTFDPSGQIMISGSDFMNIPENRSKSFVWTMDAVRAGQSEPQQVINWFEQEYFDFTDAADQLLISGNDGSIRLFDIEIDVDAVNSLGTVADVKALRVFPNPATDEVTIDMPEALRGQLTNYSWVDALGRAVRTGRLAAGNDRVAAPAAGAYTLLLEDGQGTVYRSKVIVR